MNYIIYPDEIFFKNFMMDLLAITTVKMILHRKTKTVRLILATAMESMAVTAGILVMKNYLLYTTGIWFVIQPLMILMVFGKMPVKEFFKYYVVTGMTVIFYGGVLGWFASGLHLRNHILIGVCGLPGAMILLIFVLERKRRTMDSIYQTKIVEDGREICLQGFYDTGNLLMDPYLMEPVNLIARTEFKRLCPEGKPERLIPYQALGMPHGMLETVTLEMFEITDHAEKYRVCPAVFGIVDESLLRNKGYQIIINGKILNEMGKKHAR